jgi:hypothetical protein
MLWAMCDLASTKFATPCWMHRFSFADSWGPVLVDVHALYDHWYPSISIVCTFAQAVDERKLCCKRSSYNWSSHLLASGSAIEGVACTKRLVGETER